MGKRKIEKPHAQLAESFTLNILAIPGSLRAASINAAFCRAAARLTPPDLNISVYTDLGELPHYNPDLEDALPGQVVDFRAQVANADALLIASPEYAHGVAGAMKNALDWLVSAESCAYKPVAVINTSPRAHHAYDALLEILRTMSTTIVENASVVIPLLGTCTTEEAMLDSSVVSSQIQQALEALHAFLKRSADKISTPPAASQ